MKGLILAYILAYGSAAASLRYPLIGLYVYCGFAVLRPQAIFGFAGDMSGLSNIVGYAVLIGWVLNRFGSWELGKAKPIVISLLFFTGWFLVSASQASDSTRGYAAFVELQKLVLPFLVGATMLTDKKRAVPMLWTIVLCQGYVGFEQNLMYMKGFNTAAEGFAGMDNNCFGVSLVTVIGPAIALALCAEQWWAKLLASASAALILHTVLLTYSRGAVLGLVSVGVMAFIMMPKRPRYIAALVLVALIAYRFTGPQLMARYSTIFAAEDERDYSSESRVELWADCLKVVADHPVFGVGPANWVVIVESLGWTKGKSAHSVWMESAAELGIPGVAALMTFFIWSGIRLWPIARRKMTEANRYEVAVASGVVLAITGFAVSGQFVSVPALEVPYYVTMVGVAILRSKLAQDAVTVAAAPVREALFRPAPSRVGVVTQPMGRRF